MMAGMVAGWMMSDTKREVAPIHDLAQRVEMLRYAQTKTPTVLTMPEEVRTSAVHAAGERRFSSGALSASGQQVKAWRPTVRAPGR
jgi:hypothetical protein